MVSHAKKVLVSVLLLTKLCLYPVERYMVNDHCDIVRTTCFKFYNQNRTTFGRNPVAVSTFKNE